RLPRAYHSGDSAELEWILERLGTSYAAGISLGGNVLLKYLGERSNRTPLRRAVAVSAPIDLAAAGAALDRGVNRRLYTRMFLVTLKAKAFAKIALGQLALDERHLARVRTLHEFDDLVTAPLHGFRDADDYWARASSRPWLPGIAVPTLLINARNDPFLPAAALEGLGELPASVVLEFPRAGGHAGFPGGAQWLARRVLDFLCAP
ncbi:MAG: alpha/beta fold hydrolase, partial [Pseudomonadota bacterium]